MRSLGTWLICIVCLSLAPGCASFRPRPQEDPPWVHRALVLQDGNVTASVAALTPDEGRDALGFNLAADDIQPVWVRIENREEIRYYIPPVTIDPGYYSPMEVAWKGHGWFSGDTNARIDQHFRGQRLRDFVDPGATVQGFVFTSLDEGMKYVSMELIGAGGGQVRRFAFVAPIPGLKTDYEQVDLDKLYAPDEMHDVDEEALRDWLEKLPCCTKGGDKKTDGDPLNIVMVGARRAVFPTLARRGWHVTEATTASSSWQTIMSSLFGSRYRYAPVSSLHVFGRRQDIALQKPRSNVDQRNHMRLWLAPVTLNGTPVWVGQISRDIGVRFTRKTITTHKVDPEIDETRWYLLQDMFFSQGMKRFGLVKGVGAAAPDAPRANYTGDPYYTDGLRLVIWMTEEPITYQRVEAVRWESMPDPMR
jgi:LssY C-terminus